MFLFLLSQMLCWAKNDILKQQNSFIWMVTIVEQLKQNFCKKSLSENILPMFLLSEMLCWAK